MHALSLDTRGQTPASTIQDLPDELLFCQIFRRLDFSTLASSCLVSHKWYFFALDAIERSSSLPSDQTEKVICKVSELCKKRHLLRVADLTLEQCQGFGLRFASLLKRVLQNDGHGPYLKELSLSLSYARFNVSVLSTCTALEQLELSELHFGPSEQQTLSLPKLTTLRFIHSFLPATVHWNTPLLTTLQCYWTHLPEKALISLIDQSKTSLQCLWLHPVPALSKTVMTSLHTATALTSLYLCLSLPGSRSPSIRASAEDYAYYFSTRPNLVSISLTAPPCLLAPRVIQAIARNVPSLLDLSLSFTHSHSQTRLLNVDDLIENHALRHLQSLSLVSRGTRKGVESPSVEGIAFAQGSILRSSFRDFIPNEMKRLISAFPNASISYSTIWYP